MAMTELECFRSNTYQERAPGLWITLHIDLGTEPENALEKILTVVESWLVVSDQVTRAQRTWPTEEQWKALLPRWFTATFQGHTHEDLLQHDWLWEYASWIDAMRNRVWYWWGYERRDSVLTLHLVLESWPYSVGALKYVLWAAGAQLRHIEE